MNKANGVNINSFTKIVAPQYIVVHSTFRKIACSSISNALTPERMEILRKEVFSLTPSCL